MKHSKTTGQFKELIELIFSSKKIRNFYRVRLLICMVLNEFSKLRKNLLQIYLYEVNR